MALSYFTEKNLMIEICTCKGVWGGVCECVHTLALISEDHKE